MKAATPFLVADEHAFHFNSDELCPSFEEFWSWSMIMFYTQAPRVILLLQKWFHLKVGSTILIDDAVVERLE